MNRIKLKFIGLGFENKVQASVLIYDGCNNIIYDGYTFNGCVGVELEDNRAYKLIATSLGDCISVIFYVDDKICEYKFAFERSIFNNINNKTITFTDYNYSNLPIEKGVLILWPSQ